MTTRPAPPPGDRRTFPLLAVLALAVVALLVTACSSGPAASDGVVSLDDPSASPDASASPAASQDPEEAMLAFQACMKEHGVDVQVATTGGDGDTGGKLDVHVGTGASKPGADAAQPGTGGPLDVTKLDDATKACQHLLPQSGQDGPNRTMDPQLQDQLLQFAQCMRDHGINFPDPQFDGGRVTIGLGGPNASKDGADLPDPNSKPFQDAQDACGKNLPGGAPFTVSGNGDAGEAKP